MTVLSFQLYSARFVPSFDDFLVTLGSLGYTLVEGYGGLFDDAAGLAAKLKQNGLSMPTSHFGLAQVADVSTTLKTAEALGIKKIIVPHIEAKDRSTDESKWLELAETLAKAGETYAKEGYAFGWHNHDFEFVPTSSGRTPMEIILETAPDIEWECDVAWAVRGKVDPIAWFERYGSRITAVHVKDIAPTGQKADEDGWADVGHGVLDWDNLIGKVQAKTKAQYFVAEHDKPSDAVRFATNSIATASKWK